MSQKPNFQKSAIHKPAPRKQGIFLTVRANWFFEQTSNEKGQPPLCDHIKSRMIVKSYHLCPRSSGGVKVPGWHRGRTVRGAMRSSRVRGCAHRPPWSGWGRALWCCSGAVAYGGELLRSLASGGGRCGVSAHSIEVAQIVSEGAPGLSRCKIQYIYNVLGYYQTKITLS